MTEKYTMPFRRVCTQQRTRREREREGGGSGGSTPTHIVGKATKLEIYEGSMESFLAPEGPGNMKGLALTLSDPRHADGRTGGRVLIRNEQ